MIGRALSFLFLLWLLGFAWFALLLPMPAPPERTDAIVVLTGGGGRIDRALERLEAGDAKRVLISGVDRNVKPAELAEAYGRPKRLFDCCIVLGFEAENTRANAAEVARWVARRNYKSIRLITTDWHMRRSEYELRRMLPADIRVVADAVRSQPSLSTLWWEYQKYLFGRLGGLLGL